MKNIDKKSEKETGNTTKNTKKNVVNEQGSIGKKTRRKLEKDKGIG